MIRVVAALLIVAALAGLWWHGYKRGERADKQRSDLVIAGMVNDAQSRLAAANETVRLQSASMQKRADDAATTLQTERATNQRRLADARATSDLVRDTIAEFARGAGAPDPAGAACLSRASTLGDVLGEALRAHGQCTAEAEHEASNSRALLEAWPVVK